MSFPRPGALSLGLIFRVWLSLGTQSFGGGTATLVLIRQAVVEKHRWLTEAEFVRDWALCKMTPGVGQIALAILIGRRLAGARGSIVALLGLLAPSVTITLLVTAFVDRVSHQAAARAALDGVIPATVALGLLAAQQMARPLLTAPPGDQRARWPLGVAVLAGSGLAVAFAHLPVILVLCVSGTIGALVGWRRATPGAKKPAAP